MTFGNKGKSNEVTLDFSSYAGNSVVVAFKYTSSEEVQSTFEIISFSLNEKVTQDPNAKGTENNPYTCADLLAMTDLTKNSTGKGFVTGYIVGWVSNSVSATNCKFSIDESTLQSNIMIADDENETDYKKIIPVQLATSPANCKAVRDLLNLKDNPNNLNHPVKIQGIIKKYMGANGIGNANYVEMGGSSAGAKSN